MNTRYEISRGNIVFALLSVVVAWLVFQVFDVILQFFISVVLMSALNPLVDKLEKFRLSRALSIFLVYLLIWGVVGGVLAGLLPSLIDQTSRLIRELPGAVNHIEFFTDHQQEITRELLASVGSLPQNVLKITLGIFGNFLNVLTTLAITYYLLLDRRNLSGHISSLLRSKDSSRLELVLNSLESRLGYWVRGELTLMTSIGFLTYVGLVLLGVESALPLAILAGLLEIIPNIGPVVSAVPAILVALSGHPLVPVATAVWYFLVQFFENHILVPKIMQSSVGIHPLVSMLALLIGFKLSGPAGAILSLPLIITGQIFLQASLHKSK